MDPTKNVLELDIISKKDKHQLLREIMLLSETSHNNGMTPALLKEKLEIYNSIRDHEDDLKPNFGHDPLKILPLEVWEEMIHECAGTYSNRPNDWNLDKLLELTRVSTAWRAALLQTPSFWRNINVNTSSEDLEAKVALCLRLSRDRELEIGLEIPITSCWETLGPIIAAQSSRVRSIILYTRVHDPSLDWNSVTDPALLCFGELPSLQALVSHIYGTLKADTILRRAHAISKIHGIDVSPETLGMSSLAKLRELRTPSPFESVHPYLPTLTNLKEVAFFNNQVYWIPYNQIKKVVPPQELLGWTTFYHTQRPLFSFDNFYGHLSSTLEHLSININWKGINQLISACSEMHRLYTLYLDIMYSSDPIVDLVVATPSNMREISLRLTTYINPTHQNQMVTDQGYRNNVGCLFTALKSWAPLVEILWVFTYDSPEHAFSYVESLRRLRRLEYHSQRREYLDEEVLTLPTVEEVIIDVPEPRFLSYIHCPNALFLSYCSSSVDRYPEVDKWTNLLTLTFIGTYVSWKSVSLPYVKKIILIHRGPGVYDAHNTLCGELAMRPTAFPSLQCLQMGYFPEWDTLFIMLERRNFLMDDRISPISTIAFYLSPPASLLQALAYRLSGRLSERPSNYGLSILSHLDIYFDPSILGCDMCHKGFLPCNSKVQDKFLKKINLLKTPLYPSTVDGLFSSRDDISRWFAESSAGLREHVCQRYNTANVQEITGWIEPGLLESTIP